MTLGLTELVVLLTIVLVFFGAGKLPTVAGDLAKGLRNFKKGLGEAAETGAEPAPGPEPARLEPPRSPRP